jgi:hypothetical protein
MLLLALALAAAPVDVLVVVPLCDGSQLACGKGTLGDPKSLEGNLYWGAMYGAERFLKKQSAYSVSESKAGVAPILRELKLTRKAAKGEREVRVTLVAYDGTRIDDALKYFLTAVQDQRADLVVWSGHDRLMDVAAPSVTKSENAANVAVLACESERYFGPVLDAAGANTVAVTRSFMAPEAYLLDAMLANVARHGPEDREHLRDALINAYARWQKISTKAASTVFSKLE